MNAMDAVFYIAILVMSVVIHEVCHGFMAEHFGDNTARYAGRLTLNPLRHLDPIGSVFLPALLVLVHSPFLFGWAKPVPYNPDNLSDRKWGTIAVAFAGVFANFSLAIIFGFIIRISFLFASHFIFPSGFYFITSAIVLVNLGLGIFNLVPIPPLDGSKILISFLPRSLYSVSIWLEKHSLVFLFIFIIFLSKYLGPIMYFLFHLLTRMTL